MKAPLDGPRAQQEGVSAVDAAGRHERPGAPGPAEESVAGSRGRAPRPGASSCTRRTRSSEMRCDSPFSRLIPAVGASFSNPMHGVMVLVTPQPESTERLLEAHPRATSGGAVRARRARVAALRGGVPRAGHVPAAVRALRAAVDGSARRRRPRCSEPWRAARPSAPSERWETPRASRSRGRSRTQRVARVGDVLTVRLPTAPAGERPRCRSGERAGSARTGLGRAGRGGRGRRSRCGCRRRGGSSARSGGPGSSPVRYVWCREARASDRGRGAPMRLLYVLASYVLFAVAVPGALGVPEDASRAAAAAGLLRAGHAARRARARCSGCTARAREICSRSRR